MESIRVFFSWFQMLFVMFTLNIGEDKPILRSIALGVRPTATLGNHAASSMCSRLVSQIIKCADLYIYVHIKSL